MFSNPPAQRDHVVPGSWLCSGPSFYLIQSILGEGTFGKVAKCTRMSDMKKVAIKVMKNRDSAIIDAQQEVGADQSLTSTSVWQIWFQDLLMLVKLI